MALGTQDALAHALEVENHDLKTPRGTQESTMSPIKIFLQGAFCGGLAVALVAISVVTLNSQPLPSLGNDRRSAYAPCADEGDVCACKGSVKYGALGAYRYEDALTLFAAHNLPINGKGEILVNCDNSIFSDPISGAKKKCFCDNDASLIFAAEIHNPEDDGYVMCAEEGEDCTCRGSVLYGAQGKFLHAPEATEDHGVSYTSEGEPVWSCSNDQFLADPMNGVKKACYCRFDSPGDGYEKCAEEGGSCACTGTVAFGAINAWDYKTMEEYPGFLIWGQDGGLLWECSAGQYFADPIPGSAKACYCRASSELAAAFDLPRGNPEHCSSGFSSCADGGHSCPCDGTVAYVADGDYKFFGVPPAAGEVLVLCQDFLFPDRTSADASCYCKPKSCYCQHPDLTDLFPV